MKKKPIYLYVLLGLETVGTLWELISKFSSSNDAVETLLKGINEPAKSQYAAYFSKSAELLFTSRTFLLAWLEQRMVMW